MSRITVRICRTASTTLPVPASPLVRIMAAPSPIRRKASPKSRQPQTKGTLKACLLMWFSSSAGVSTSLSSMKSTPMASSIWASTKCPIRHLAITGMVTASMISLIILGSDMRATPPCFRMSAGTRSRAITATAPASSAMTACSALTTSMITPPFNISARPTLVRHVAFWASYSDTLISHLLSIKKLYLLLHPFPLREKPGCAAPFLRPKHVAQKENQGPAVGSEHERWIHPQEYVETRPKGERGADEASGAHGRTGSCRDSRRHRRKDIQECRGFPGPLQAVVRAVLPLKLPALLGR